jgi:hypothetical protein
MAGRGGCMVKSRLLLKLGLLIVFMTAFTVYGAYHCKIVEGPYDKLTISNMDGIIHVIEDKSEIEKIVSKINEGKRSSTIMMALHTILYPMAS